MHKSLSRNALRTGHLVEGALVLAYVYTPLGSWDPGRLFVQAVVMPAIITTGLLMWKLPAWRARARRRARMAAHA
jgi:hypothetical protein